MTTIQSLATILIILCDLRPQVCDPSSPAASQVSVSLAKWLLTTTVSTQLYTIVLDSDSDLDNGIVSDTALSRQWESVELGLKLSLPSPSSVAYILGFLFCRQSG